MAKVDYVPVKIADFPLNVKLVAENEVPYIVAL